MEESEIEKLIELLDNAIGEGNTKAIIFALVAFDEFASDITNEDQISRIEALQESSNYVLNN